MEIKQKGKKQSEAEAISVGTQSDEEIKRSEEEARWKKVDRAES